jgi:hypothetical protein
MKKYIILIISIGALWSSCTEDFDSINKNPNGSTSVEPEFLLTNVLTNVAQASTYDQGFRLSNFICQYSSDIEFERIDRYEMGSNAGHWNLLYRNLTDIKSMQSVPSTNEAYKAVGDVMKSYIFAQLTDMWGDIPYSEALKAKEGISAPKYDTQEEIYTGPNGILAKLENAAKILSTTKEKISGDVMYSGNLLKWEKFSNSLQVRYRVQVSKKLKDFVKLQELVNGGKIITTNADNAIIPYLAAAPNQFPLSQAALGIYNGHRMSSTIGNVLTGWSDPRIAVLFKPTTKSIASGSPLYKGLQNGLTRESIASRGVDLNDISLFGSIWRDIPNGVDAQYIQASEVLFALAEAAENKWITGNAKDYYESAVKAHFAYLKVSLPSDYLTKSATALNGTDNLKKIMTQKWVALISNGHEAWFNIRRTSIPALIPGPDNMNDGRFPSRYLYPEGEQATNAENYKTAAQRLGGDNINSKVWWEK